jgi:hypothetical protein
MVRATAGTGVNSCVNAAASFGGRGELKKKSKPSVAYDYSNSPPDRPRWRGLPDHVRADHPSLFEGRVSRRTTLTDSDTPNRLPRFGRR